MFLFHRSFWRLIAMTSAFGAATYLARSLRHPSMPALPAPGDESAKRMPRRPKRAPAATGSEAGTNGNGRTAH